VIWRLRERSAFGRLSTHGLRARAGVLWCSYILDTPDVSTPPRVAFAVGRAHGPAVVRNRVRRRLRAMLQVASGEGRLPGGEYLIGLRPGGAGQSFAALQADLDQLLSRIRP